MLRAAWEIVEYRDSRDFSWWWAAASRFGSIHWRIDSNRAVTCEVAFRLLAVGCELAMVLLHAVMSGVTAAAVCGLVVSNRYP